MATATTTLILSNNTQANFNAWAQWIHDRLAAFGLIQTADTGQLANPIVAAVPAGNTPAGYEIWRLNDALQATKPVFIKIEYGTGGASAPVGMGVWITIGTGSNGAGSLTGALTFRISGLINGYITAPQNLYASGDASRFCFALGSDPIVPNNQNYIYFGVERTKNADGTDSVEGAILLITQYSSNSGSTCNHQTMPFVGSNNGLEVFGTGDLPTSGQTTGVFGTDMMTFAIRPQLFYPRNPMMNWCVYYNADFVRETPVTLDAYGANHTYLPLGTGPTSSPKFNQTGNTSARLMMRWE